MSIEIVRPKSDDLNKALHAIFEAHGIDEYLCSYTVPPHEGIRLTLSCYAGYIIKVVDMLAQFYVKEKKEFYEQKESKVTK